MLKNCFSIILFLYIYRHKDIFIFFIYIYIYKKFYPNIENIERISISENERIIFYWLV